MSRIDQKDYAILSNISSMINQDDFYVIGSNTYRENAKKLGVDIPKSDHDLVVVGSKKDYNSLKSQLKRKKFRIIRDIPYWLKFNHSYQIIAHNGKWTLDIAIAKNINHIGHFNWECIFWHYPSGNIIDNHNALSAMKKRKLTPVIGAYDENPYILISRLINLCSRFEIDPYQEGTLRDFTKKIVNSARIWRGKGHFQQVYARGHAYGGVVKAILSSRRRNEFMRMLQREGILEVLLPEISSILSIRTRPIPGIEQARTSEEVLNCLRHLLKDKPDEAVSFEARIKLIRRRMKNSIFL